MGYFVVADGKWIKVPHAVVIALGALETIDGRVEDTGLASVVELPLPGSEEAKDLGYFCPSEYKDILGGLLCKYGGQKVGLW